MYNVYMFAVEVCSINPVEEKTVSMSNRRSNADQYVQHNHCIDGHKLKLLNFKLSFS
jgi:hypothetical protein